MIDNYITEGDFTISGLVWISFIQTRFVNALLEWVGQVFALLYVD